MQRIAQNSFAIQVFGDREAISVVDHDKPNAGETFAIPNRTSPHPDRTSMTNVQLKRRDLTKFPVEQAE
jgi:hypothetical protein